MHSRDEIEPFLRRDPYLHLYALGDLDPFFWPYTTWYGLRAGGHLEQICLLYSGVTPPVLLALAGAPLDSLYDLLRQIRPLLPARFYAHLSEGAAAILATGYEIFSFGRHEKMGLRAPARLEAVDTGEVVPLVAADRDELEVLYEVSYPGNAFDPRMLETGFYGGIRRYGRLVSAAGIHTYSRQYRVAVLGNVTTHPDFRGQGLGTAVTARLCRALLPTVDHVGLNVKANNEAALHCYQKLGFERTHVYEEVLLEIKREPG